MKLETVVLVSLECTVAAVMRLDGMWRACVRACVRVWRGCERVYLCVVCGIQIIVEKSYFHYTYVLIRSVLCSVRIAYQLVLRLYGRTYTL